MPLSRARRGFDTCSRTFASRAISKRTSSVSRSGVQSASPVKHTPASSGRQRLPLYLGALAVYGVSIYLGSTLYQIYKVPTTTTHIEPALADLNHATDQSAEIYDEIASEYDSSIKYEELFSGITWLRRSIVQHLVGDILEVSAGTGRNLSYYNFDRVSSLTLLDQSRPMLDVARRKVAADDKWNNKVHFKDVALEGVSPNRDSYDVVFQTFGLCSVSDPVAFLSQMSKFCRADGEIILIEHGRSWYEWLNRLLDNNVDRHAARWGCHYNRDIDTLVRACKDVKVVTCERRHFGTTYVYHLKPN